MSINPFDEDPLADSGVSDFFSGGSPSCKFEQIGAMHRGTILSMEKSQQREIGTNKPKFWADGNPCEQVIITIQTNERDEEIEDDDGARRLYVNKPGGMFSAIKKAMGSNKQLLPGGTLAVKYVKNGKPKQAGFNAPKEYMAHYAPPGNGSVAPPQRSVAQQLRQQQQPVGAEVLDDNPLDDDGGPAF